MTPPNLKIQTSLKHYLIEAACMIGCVFGIVLCMFLYVAATDPSALRDWVAQ